MRNGLYDQFGMMKEAKDTGYEPVDETDVDKVLAEIYKCGSKEEEEQLAKASIAYWDGEMVETFESFAESGKPLSDFWQNIFNKMDRK